MSGGMYSELEFLILAMVGEGVSSGYAIRKQMNRMRGGRWSAESGSVYRVLRRLEKEKLLTETRKIGVKNRERTEYALTQYGESLLLSWLTFPPDRSELGFLVDPLRTRSYFLMRLKPQEQMRVVRAWIQENKKFVAELKTELEGIKADHPLYLAGYENMLFLASARTDWLKKLLSKLKAFYADLDDAS